MPEINFTYKASAIQGDLGFVLLNFESYIDEALNAIEIQQSKLEREGYKKADISAFIKNSIGEGSDFWKAFDNKLDKMIDDLTNQLVARPAREFDRQHPGAIYDWVLGTVKTSHCTDCKAHSGMAPRTIDEWLKLEKGLPGDGKTVCRQGCRCQLQIVSYEKPKEEIEEKSPKQSTEFVPAKTVKEVDDILGINNLPSDTEKIVNISIGENELKMMEKFNLSKDEILALKRYTNTDYVDINNSLRSNNITDDQNKIIAKMDNSFKNNSIENITVYRGVKTEQVVDKFKIGLTYKDPAFLSTSTDVSVAERFSGIGASDSNTKNSAILVIKVEKIPGIKVSTISSHPNESEILFGRDTFFTVDNIAIEENGLKYIYCRASHE